MVHAPSRAFGIPKVRVTDGPSGVRGGSIPGATTTTSLNVPCAAALGATFDVELVEQIGRAVGAEARTKAARVLLAPTVNIHRSPLSGRNFECYSEDPLLSGKSGAAFIKGAQSQGVATTVKHFAGNEAETERYTTSFDRRRPRHARDLPGAVRARGERGRTLGVMTGYNRLNGPWCAEHEELLAGILRGEWGFDGFVLSDWFACAHTVQALRAGLDLEMPGTGRFYAPAEDHGRDRRWRSRRIRSRRAGAPAALGVRAGRRLQRPHRTAARRGRRPARRSRARAPGRVGVDGAAAQHRRVAARRREDAHDRGARPNADRLNVNGGGSASLNPHHRSELLPAIRSRFTSDVELAHVAGCDIDTSTPALRVPVTADVYAGTDWQGDVRLTKSFSSSELLFFGPVDDIGEEFSFRARHRHA